MVEDLSRYPIPEIEASIRGYRQDASARFFPTSGQLIEPIKKARREFAQANKISSKPLVESRPLMWWMKPRKLWASHWRESEVPAAELVRDQKTGEWRHTI